MTARSHHDPKNRVDALLYVLDQLEALHEHRDKLPYFHAIEEALEQRIEQLAQELSR